MHRSLQGITYRQLAANKELLSSIVAAHIVLSVLPYSDLTAAATDVSVSSADRVFQAANSCSAFWPSQNADWELVLIGLALIQDETCLILEEDLVAGQFALIHVVDAVLLPVGKWGSSCHLDDTDSGAGANQQQGGATFQGSTSSLGANSSI